MAYIGRQPTVGNFRICDAISVVDGQAAYTMQVDGVNVIPESANNMIVSLNGVIQKPGSSYTVSSSTITFSSNLSTGDVIDFIQILGGVANIGTPSDGTVTSAKLATDIDISTTGTVTTAGVITDSLTKTGNLTVDVSGNIRLDADDSGEVRLLDGGTQYAVLKNDDSRLKIQSTISDKDILIVGNDGGVETTAVAIDMSEGGRSRFYGGVSLGGDGAANTLDDYEEGTWTVDFKRSGSSIGSFNNRSAYYTKIGNVVYVNASTQYTGSSLTGAYITGDGLPFTISSQNKTGVAGTYQLGPGSGSTNQQCGSAGGWNEQDDFFMVPGGVGQDRYLDEWQQNYYINVAFWYYTDA